MLGVLVTISSVGAGAIGVTALLLLYPRAKVAVIVGSDIAHAVPLTLAAGLGHWYRQHRLGVAGFLADRLAARHRDRLRPGVARAGDRASAGAGACAYGGQRPPRDVAQPRYEPLGLRPALPINRFPLKRMLAAAGRSRSRAEAEAIRREPDRGAHAVAELAHPPGDDSQGLVSQSFASNACSACICANQSAPSAQAA